MSSMREIKQRITATSKTSQITKAMHMVSASKLKKAERNIVAFRPLTERLSRTLSHILASDSTLSHAMLEAREIKRTVYLLISSDRGLAGPYNASVFKAFEYHIQKEHASHDEFVVAPIGFKASNYVKRKGYQSLNDAVIQVRDDVQFLDFQTVSDAFIKGYLKGDFDRIVVFYNKFINTMTQTVEHQTLIPMVLNPHIDTQKKEGLQSLYVFEPDAATVLNDLLPMYVVNVLYGMILEAKASEHAARMTAMKNATDNAKELIRTLKLSYNRARQDAITIELTDIIGGANAVN